MIRDKKNRYRESKYVARSNRSAARSARKNVSLKIRDRGIGPASRRAHNLQDPL